MNLSLSNDFTDIAHNGDTVDKMAIRIYDYIKHEPDQNVAHHMAECFKSMVDSINALDEDRKSFKNEAAEHDDEKIKGFALMNPENLLEGEYVKACTTMFEYARAGKKNIIEITNLIEHETNN